MNKYIKAGVLLFLVAIPAFLFSLLDVSEPYGKVRLQKYYPQGIESLTKDTIYHRVPYYSYLNQDSVLIDSNFVENKIQVVDFKFTSCETICPKMTSNMVDVYSKFLDNKDLVFISFTVDPIKDTPSILKRYQNDYKVRNKNWAFLTGEAFSIYELARKGFFISGYYDVNVNDFVHSEKVILVDKSRVIRGYYDATDKEEIERLKIEIKVLKKEYEQQKNSN